MFEEPVDAVGPEVRAYMAAIGIVKDKPFNPDARMKKLLTEAAMLGNAGGVKPAMTTTQLAARPRG